MRLLFLLALPTLAAAAVAQPVTDPAPCSYDECAIRIEQGFFGGIRIVRGTPGEDIDAGSVGWFGGGLSDYVSDSPAALAHAEAAESYQMWSLATAVAAGVALALSVDQIYSTDDPGVPVYYIAGLGLAVTSGVLRLNAGRQQARAVWEYNRTLAAE